MCIRDSYGALASCLYATFLGILEKKRIEIEGTEIVVEGEKRTEVPTTLKTVHLTVTIRGTDKEDAVRKSFDLEMCIRDRRRTCIN